MCLTLYRPCAYGGAVVRHASGPTGPQNSQSFFVDLNRRSQDRQNHVAPKSKPSSASQKPDLTKTLPWACKLFLKFDIFSQAFVGRHFFAGFRGSVGRYFEDQPGEKSFSIQPSTYRSCPKRPVNAVSTTNMPFVRLWSWQPAPSQARKDPCLFFLAHDHNRLLF